MNFRKGDKWYQGATAAEIVRALERDAADYPHQGARLCEFLRWSFAQCGDRIPQRELDLSARLDDETLALGYLCLCEQYGLGELSDVLPRKRVSDLGSHIGCQHHAKEELR